MFVAPGQASPASRLWFTRQTSGTSGSRLESNGPGERALVTVLATFDCLTEQDPPFSSSCFTVIGLCVLGTWLLPAAQLRAERGQTTQFVDRVTRVQTDYWAPSGLDGNWEQGVHQELGLGG